MLWPRVWIRTYSDGLMQPQHIGWSNCCKVLEILCYILQTSSGKKNPVTTSVDCLYRYIHLQRGVEPWVRLVDINTCAQLQEPQLLMEPAGCWRLNSETFGDALKPGTSHRRPLLRGATDRNHIHLAWFVAEPDNNTSFYRGAGIVSAETLIVKPLICPSAGDSERTISLLILWRCGLWGAVVHFRCCDVGQTSCTHPYNVGPPR
jgi:hypothetical protein